MDHSDKKPDDSHTWDRIKEALRRDWDQTKHDFGAKFGQDLQQNVTDTVSQAAGSQPIPSRHVANPTDADSDDVGLRFGYDAARSAPYQHQSDWTQALDGELRTSWDATKSNRTWDEVRLAARYGWMRARGGASS